MLIFARKVNEGFLIGHDIQIRITGVRAGVVRLEVVAPGNASIKKTGPSLISFNGADFKSINDKDICLVGSERLSET